MSLHWQDLRPWQGSQNTAFEELCCQLAAHESVPLGSHFIRKGAPDAGVECFWQLPNGDEWAWQAKFFLSSVEDGQWRQLDESVRTALEKHPRLTSYTVCLPIDRQDPRIDRQKWFMDRWNERVDKWREWARAKGMPTTFHYWGDHEIWEHLSRAKHRGRLFFWFNKESLSREWFEDRLEEVIADAGPRYTPELNVSLPIAHLFDGLGRTSAFCHRVRVFRSRIRRNYSKAMPKRVGDAAQAGFHMLGESIDPLLSLLESINTTGTDPIPFANITDLAFAARNSAWECIDRLEEAAREEKEKAVLPSAGDQGSSQGEKPYRPPNDFNSERYYLRELSKSLGALRDFAQSSEARLATTPALLLAGDAGMGKTHLFCDMAIHRVADDLPTVLLLGEYFRNEEPWSQIIRLLGLSCTREEFLGALEAAAQLHGSRALILIDALNEGEGRELWDRHLAGMLITLSRHPRIGIALSVRTSYESVVIPGSLVPTRLIREEHAGFADHEYQAAHTFFGHYGIEFPSVPLLAPEFQRPMFLKLFCQGLKNSYLTRVPAGFQGVTSIFAFFIVSVNQKLSNPQYLDFDSTSHVVQQAVEKLIDKMAESGLRWLPRPEARATVNGLLPDRGYEKSLFRHMVAEGLLAEDRLLDETGTWYEGVRFSYERLADHLLAQYLLDKYLDPEQPARSFAPGQPLGSLIVDERACRRNRGLLEAFSVQIPERVGHEFAEVAAESAHYLPVREAFIESLIWRQTRAFTSSTLKYIGEQVLPHADTSGLFLDALLTVAANPDHPCNADFLHAHLIRLEMADRDAWWSIFLHETYGTMGAADRLVDWTWSQEDKSHIDDASVRLCGIALGWFLTSSHRFLRDRATKALVTLFTNRKRILREVILEFLEVDDPYILERLFAVAYGCSMRTEDNAELAPLAQDIYRWVFESGEPIPHILLRDYTRGTIELAISRGVELQIDVAKIRPPYKSEWPGGEIPSAEELRQYVEEREEEDEGGALWLIYDSVMGSNSVTGGDFTRYVIGTSSVRFPWSSRRLGQVHALSQKERYQNFISTLTSKQGKMWERYERIRRDSIRRWLMALSRPNAESEREEAEDEIAQAERSFRSTLGKKKLATFEEHIFPYMEDPQRFEREYDFDLSLAQRWIFQRVLDLGWTEEHFGGFDRSVTHYGSRESHKPERIGKKYQWLAYHEFLARVSDNFEFRGDGWSDQPTFYDGPWQLDFIRDIDPSLLFKRTGHARWELDTKSWWFASPYSAWDVDAHDDEWLRRSEDLPPAQTLIEVTHPQDRSEWLVLEASYEWNQPILDEERSEVPRRHIWYILRSCLVQKSQIDEVANWARAQQSSEWMPPAAGLTPVFLGEFFWSPACEWYCGDEWTSGFAYPVPHPVLVLAEQYLREDTGYDCSIDETIQSYLPAKWFADHLGLHWNGDGACFCDHRGEVIAFDPSVTTSGPSALLVRREALVEFLNNRGYDILWVILGEKEVVGGSMSGTEWPGKLQLYGVYPGLEGKVHGSVATTFIGGSSPGA